VVLSAQVVATAMTIDDELIGAIADASEAHDDGRDDSAPLAQVVDAIRRGADPNRISISGGREKSAFVYAFYSARRTINVRLVETLIAHGADPSEKADGAVYPLYLACRRYDCPELVPILCRAGSRITPDIVLATANEGFERNLRALVACGARLDEPYRAGRGFTCLHLALHAANWRSSLLLLRSGASLVLPGFAVESMEEAVTWVAHRRPLDETEGDEKYEDDFARVNALVARIRDAGSWKQHLATPRLRLLSLRQLCAEGRASPPREALLEFCFPGQPSGHRTRTRRRYAVRLPDPAFELVLRFWWGG